MAKQEDELRLLMKLTDQSLSIAERQNLNFLKLLISMVAYEALQEIDRRQKAA